MRSLSALVSCLVLAGAAVVQPAAAQLASTYTYPGLTWGFSTGQSGFSSCSTLSLDATGAAGKSDYYSVYGTLYCPSLGGSYANVGSAYFDSAGHFNMTISLGVTHNLVCNNLSASTFSGQCPIYDNLGSQTGFAVINLL